jgi:hypothetical protein
VYFLLTRLLFRLRIFEVINVRYENLFNYSAIRINWLFDAMGYSNHRVSRFSRLSENTGQTHQSAVRFNRSFKPKGYPIRQFVPEHRPDESKGCPIRQAVRKKRLSECIDQSVESASLLNGSASWIGFRVGLPIQQRRPKIRTLSFREIQVIRS